MYPPELLLAVTERRDELIELAELLLEREGIDSFGISSLAREAKIRPPSLYKHFVSIVEIEHTLIARWLRRFTRVISTAERGLFATIYRDFAAQGPETYKLVMSRSLDRRILVNVDPGCDVAALKAIAKYLDDQSERHEHTRVAWATVHGLVSLEQLGLLPGDTDLDSTLESWIARVR